MGEPTLSLNDDFEAWLILAKPDGALEIFFDQLFKLFFVLDFRSTCPSRLDPAEWIAAVFRKNLYISKRLASKRKPLTISFRLNGRAPQSRCRVVPSLELLRFCSATNSAPA